MVDNEIMASKNSKRKKKLQVKQAADSLREKELEIFSIQLVKISDENRIVKQEEHKMVQSHQKARDRDRIRESQSSGCLKLVNSVPDEEKVQDCLIVNSNAV